MISLKNISKTFYIKNQITHALDNVSLEIDKGDIYGVVGESGAGKSTLIRCVNLLERPSSGSVIIDDTNLMTLPHQKLLKVRHGIGMIFQHFNLLSNRNVFDNIALPLELIGVKKTHIHKKVQSLLEITGLEDRSKYYPAQLSGGQKQRVAIARALAADTKILLSDEATSALDPKTTDAILSLLNNINRELDVTILMITHEMEVVKKICNKVALLDQGRLVEHNSIKNFFSNPQSDLGRKFIQQIQDFDIPAFYKDKIQSSGTYPIVKMIFNSDHIQSPVLSALTKKFSIDVNIVQAKIEQLQSSTTGMLIAELIADETQLKDGLAWLNTQSLKTEVLGYVD